MRRSLAAFIVIVALVSGAVWLADRPGSVAVVWQGWRIDTSVAVLGLGTILAAGIAAWLLVMLRKIWRAPGNFLKARRERRRREGYRALTLGLAAVAAGDAAEAETFARRAGKLLAEPPLTLLLAAQTAQLKGDDDAARRAFTAMLDAPETEFLGLRGLLIQALKRGEEGVALKLVERARDLRPRTPWVLRARYELEARAGDWDQAEASLAEAARRRALPPAESRHHQAAILYEKARAAKAAGQDDEALSLGRAAHRAAPGFAAATQFYAGLLSAQGSKRRARKAIEAGWRAAPHPDLASSYAGLYPEATALERLQRLETLAALKPEAEGHVALAQAALKARLWGEARRHLKEAGLEGGNGHPASPRLCRMMAELEEAEHGDHEAARRWRERAAESETPDPAYACNACGHENSRWSALCPRCRGFDQLVWRRHPGRGEAAGGEFAGLWPVPGSSGTAARIDAPAQAVVGSAAFATPSADVAQR